MLCRLLSMMDASLEWLGIWTPSLHMEFWVQTFTQRRCRNLPFFSLPLALLVGSLECAQDPAGAGLHLPPFSLALAHLVRCRLG